MRIFIYLIVLFFTHPSWADIHFLTISDVHYGSENSSKDGSDTDITLLASTLTKFSSLASQVDFILTLGDFPTHMFMNSPLKATYIADVFHGLYHADKADKPMFYITGNNDSLGGNYQPFSWNGESPLSLAKEWQGACVHCEGLIIDGKNMWDKGYYTSYVIPNNKDIVLIALNSTQFAKIPLLAPSYPNQKKHATEQLQWLEEQLKTLNAKQLLIAMHIPPGFSYKGTLSWHKDYLNQFIGLLSRTHERYEQISLLTAHTHMDDIRRIRLDDGTNIYAYATPSISRIHHNYPAMKVFDLDITPKMSDYTTHYTPNDIKWDDDHYQAMKDIFPNCKNNDLVSCLDTLTSEQTCEMLQTGQFYGAKGPRVDGSVCKTTYSAN